MAAPEQSRVQPLAQALAEHFGNIDDIIAASPRAVWMQLGIRNDDAAARLLAAGIDVVQDRCLLVELQRLGR